MTRVLLALFMLLLIAPVLFAVVRYAPLPLLIVAACAAGVKSAGRN